MRKRGSKYGFSGRPFTGVAFGACLPLPLQAQQLRGADGSAEKIEQFFAGLSELRIHAQTFELHPDDHARVIAGLESLGHTVRASKNHFFVDDRFRVTTTGPDANGASVHLTDLRAYN